MATITERNGSYKITVSCGYNSKGVQQRRHMTWTPDAKMTARQIEKELNRQATLFEERVKNTGGASGSVKFEVFAEEWFSSYAEKRLKASTIARYRRLCPRIFAAIGSKRIDKITVRDIQHFIDDLGAAGTRQPNGKKEQRADPRGLSPKTIRHYMSLISVILDYAMKLDMITDNPCRRVTLPALDNTEKDIYTIEEAARFLELLEHEDMQYRVFFTLAIYTGMRRGELLGLEWKDIDFKSDLVNIVRTSQYNSSKGIYTDTPKTKKSTRTLKIPAALTELLHEYRVHQLEQRFQLGTQWIDTDRLFVRWNGEPIHPDMPYKWLHRFCERNALRPVTVHSFRHLNATMLINAGVDIRTTSAMLGHSNTTTTLNIYAHTYAESMARASEAVANVLPLGNKKAGEKKA